MTTGQPGGTGTRRALVVGVGQTQDLGRYPELAARFPPLESAATDVDLVATALRQSRYDVRRLHDVGGAQLRGELVEYFTSCEPGDTALVYLSGHGTTLNNRSYLLPADAQSRPGPPGGERTLYDATLIPADPEGLLTGLPSGVTAVICLDMCRTDGGGPIPTQRHTVLAADQEVYWLYSCARGEQAYADAQSGSWFGRALAHALTPTTRPTTFEEILAHTRATVRDAATRAALPPPQIEPQRPYGRPAGASDPVLCDGAQEAYRWTTMIEQSSLWRFTSGGEATHERVKKALGELVEHVVDALAGAGAHRDDPWADPTYPVRVVERLSALVERAAPGGRDLLSPAETAVLLAAPVVHEGVVALALDELCRVAPERLDRGVTTAEGHTQLVRDAAHDVCRAHSQVRRAAATLRRRRLPDRALAADHWLRHRFIAEWDLLWERTGAYPDVDGIVDLTVSAVLAASQDTSAGRLRDETRLTVDRQLRQVLAHLTVQPSVSPRINDPGLGDEWNLYPPVPGNGWRAPDLARLLWTAALLAADPRRMSSVLVDHLGAHKPLDPAEVVATLSADFGYDPVEPERSDDGYELAVRFLCPHPALHVAVEELVARVNASLQPLRTDRHGQRTTAPTLLRGLPGRVTSAQLIPLERRYQQPLERFRLAEDEIRPLLMGTQLYGDRMLSVRELYQNALDACRHRDMRRLYGATQGRGGPDWSPKILFTQGVDEDGRPYIECQDNGSGMSRAKLTSMFARAGKRYEQDPEFIQERRNWRRAGLHEMPLNSRFGIGVFSYFMLAEEVVVWTSPVDRYGRPKEPEPLRADIQSGSGLLRIGKDPRVSLDGGTRVRLYLGDDEKRPPSMLDALESQLWVADFEVEAVEYAVGDPDRAPRRARWKAGELREANLELKGEGRTAQGSADVWLIQGKGKLLLDGVAIRSGTSSRPDVFGYVFNLRERHRPEPRVDRNQLRSYDVDAVQRELLTVAETAAAQWNTVSLRWLWELASQEPLLAVKVLDALPPGANVVLRPEDFPMGELPFPRQAPIASTGCLPFDNPNKTRNAGPGHLPTDGPHENGIARLWQQSRLRTLTGGQPFLPPGYPEPDSLDALLFRTTPRGWSSAFDTAAAGQVSLGQVLRAWRRYAIVGFEVPAAQDIRALRDTAPDALMAQLHASYASASSDAALHAPLLAAGARWRKPLGEVAEVLRTLRTLDPTLPQPPALDAALAAEVPTPSDRRSLFRSVQGRVSRHQAELRTFSLFRQTSGGQAMADVLDRARHFAPLGWSVPDEIPATLWKQAPLDTTTWLILSRDHDGNEPWFEEAYPLAAFLSRAALLQVTPGRLHELIGETAAVLGITLPKIPEGLADWVPSRLVIDALNSVEDGREDRIGPWQFTLCVAESHRYHNDTGAVTELLRRDLHMLDLCGVLTPDCADRIEDVLSQLEVGSVLLRLVDELPMSEEQAALGQALDRHGVSLATLMFLSMTDNISLGAALDTLTAEERTLPLALPQLPDAARDLRIDYTDRAMLLLTPLETVTTFSLSRLLDYARSLRRPLAAALDRLATFTVLGIPAPPGDFSGPDAEALADFEPDDFDLAAFDRGLLGPGALGTLELVRVAGRFGRSLAATYERYAPFRCLGLEVTVDAPSGDEAGLIPDWRDLILLTEQLTGRHPALTGDVAPDHLTLCAEETDLTVPEVRARLARYARLFSLTLPPEGTPAS
ncbi:caspase family protein [Streptomyces sp. NPDC016845]|uniref:HD domain-containing protein n=1 Tax=Streptomyces sp. NPDC016845 TaxID=3364972 RepID=UPI00378C1617